MKSKQPAAPTRQDVERLQRQLHVEKQQHLEARKMLMAGSSAYDHLKKQFEQVEAENERLRSDLARAYGGLTLVESQRPNWWERLLQWSPA